MGLMLPYQLTVIRRHTVFIVVFLVVILLFKLVQVLVFCVETSTSIIALSAES